MDITKYEPLWGSWYVDSLIGEGSFGKVYKVHREEFGKTYYSAVKIINIPQSESDLRHVRGEGMDRASMREYFQAFVTDIVLEIELMSEFRGNSNIVSFEDHKVIEKTGEIGWDILIRMELLKSFNDHVADETMTTDEVIKLGIHICRALELCAIKKTIHRDIKPDNIFISQYGDYKLGDFGIARQIERTSSGLSKKGTYTYMAPEVFNGQEYGSNVDMYSLGIVMYRFLNNNRTPFLPDYPQTITPKGREDALYRRMRGEPLPPIKGIDANLNAIVLKACDFNRNARFNSPTEMRMALEAIAGNKNQAIPISVDNLKSPPAHIPQEERATDVFSNVPPVPISTPVERSPFRKEDIPAKPLNAPISSQVIDKPKPSPTPFKNNVTEKSYEPIKSMQAPKNTYEPIKSMQSQKTTYEPIKAAQSQKSTYEPFKKTPTNDPSFNAAPPPAQQQNTFYASNPWNNSQTNYSPPQPMYYSPKKISPLVWILIASGLSIAIFAVLFLIFSL